MAAVLPGVERLLWFADGGDTVAMWAGRMVTVDREAGTEHWFFHWKPPR